MAADFQAEEPREDFFYIEPGGKHWSPFVKIDPLPLDALRRIRAQAEALAARKSDKPKPDASDKKRAALAARELAYEFSVGGLTAKEVAVLAAILYGDRHPDASSFLRYAKSTKPGSR